MLIGLNENRTFTWGQVNLLLPTIVKITKDYKLKAESKMHILEQISTAKHDLISQKEQEIDQLIAKWKSKMIRLGAKPAGLWCVDFDNGKGYYCWKYPEDKIYFWHGYQEGFSNRRPLEQSLLHSD